MEKIINNNGVGFKGAFFRFIWAISETLIDIKSGVIC